MRVIRMLGLALVLGATVSACATSRARSSAFKPWPSKPPQCEFEVFEEDFEPPRPYAVLGSLDFNANQWLGEKGRKEVLSETACKAGADAVLLSRPYEHKFGRETIRSYEARFVVYTDVPPPPGAQPEHTE